MGDIEITNRHFKVLHIDGSGRGIKDDGKIVYGVGTHIVELCKGLENKNVQCIIASSSKWLIEKTESNGSATVLIPPFREKKTLAGVIAPINVFRILKILNPILISKDTIVHIHITTVAEMLLGKMIKRLYGIPVIGTVHTYLLFRKGHPLYRLVPFPWLLNEYDSIIAVSQELVSNIVQFIDYNIHYIINGVDVDLDRESLIRIPRIVFPIRLFEVNMRVVSLFLDAIDLIKDSLGDVQVLFIGEGNYNKIVSERINDINSNKYIIAHIKYLEPDRMIDTLATSMLSICSGRTAIESICSRTPTMLLSPHGYLKLVNEDFLERAEYSNFSGRYLNDLPSAEDLARDILFVLNNRETIQKELLVDYLVDIQVERTLKLYY